MENLKNQLDNIKIYWWDETINLPRICFECKNERYAIVKDGDEYLLADCNNDLIETFTDCDILVDFITREIQGNVFEELRTGLQQALNLEEQISELQDVVASLMAQQEILRDELCEIIFEGEPVTDINRRVTIDRIKERLNYAEWLLD